MGVNMKVKKHKKKERTKSKDRKVRKERSQQSKHARVESGPRRKAHATRSISSPRVAPPLFACTAEDTNRYGRQRGTPGWKRKRANPTFQGFSCCRKSCQTSNSDEPAGLLNVTVHDGPLRPFPHCCCPCCFLRCCGCALKKKKKTVRVNAKEQMRGKGSVASCQCSEREKKRGKRASWQRLQEVKGVCLRAILPLQSSSTVILPRQVLPLLIPSFHGREERQNWQTKEDNVALHALLHSYSSRWPPRFSIARANTAKRKRRFLSHLSGHRDCGDGKQSFSLFLCRCRFFR